MKWFLLFILLQTQTILARTICILIHGTWGIESEWYLPGGEFFNEFNKQMIELNPKAHCISFTWSGRNAHCARVHAAQQLKYLISSYSPKTTFIIIGHSHGANVAFMTSQFLSQEREGKYKIQSIYALGAPIHIEQYNPNMQIIDFVYNFFSFNDLVQPVFGIFERQFPPHERITNIRVLIDNKQPSHSNLHGAIIAKWLPHVHDMFNQKGKSEKIDLEKPWLFHFKIDEYPSFELDTQRNSLMEQDKRQFLE